MFDLSCLARFAENTKSMWLILHFLIRRSKHRFTACCCFHDSKLTKLWKATVFLDAKQCNARNAHTQRCNTRVPRGPIKKCIPRRTCFASDFVPDFVPKQWQEFGDQIVVQFSPQKRETITTISQHTLVHRRWHPCEFFICPPVSLSCESLNCLFSFFSFSCEFFELNFLSFLN